MVGGRGLIGTHHVLSEVNQPEQFRDWADGRVPESELLSGYKVLLRGTLQVFQDRLCLTLDQLGVEENLEYHRARSKIADIDSLGATSEAAHLIKHLKQFDEDIHRAHNFEYLSKAVEELTEAVLEPFGELLGNIGIPSNESSSETVRNYIALDSLTHLGNDANRGYPECFVVGWLPTRLRQEDFDSAFSGFKYALYWAYQTLGRDAVDFTAVEECVLGAENWSKLNREYHSVREELLDPFDVSIDDDGELNFDLTGVDNLDPISHLLTDAPDPAVGIEKSLDRLFLWDHVNKADDVIYGSGGAGFLILLRGIRGLKRPQGIDTPIQVRRLKDQDRPGFNYSYGIELSGWAPEGTGTLHGWAVFIRVATDYSGFGGTQYRVVEDRLEQLSQEGVIEVRELVVDEDTLEEYLTQNGTRTEWTPTDSGEPTFDQRGLSRIIRDGEGPRTEFKKEALDSGLEIGKEIVALANHNGGVLIFGITDDGDIIGVEDPDELDNRISGILRNNLTPPLSANIEVVAHRDGELVIVDIPDSDRPVANGNYIYYFRNGRNVRKLTYPELKKRYG